VVSGVTGIWSEPRTSSPATCMGSWGVSILLKPSIVTRFSRASVVRWTPGMWLVYSEKPPYFSTSGVSQIIIPSLHGSFSNQKVNCFALSILICRAFENQAFHKVHGDYWKDLFCCILYVDFRQVLYYIKSETIWSRI
jgi:hypothetical protein